MFEYRICWNAWTNITFRGATDWEIDDEAETADEVESYLYEGTNNLCLGLQIALESSGFDWWVEVREVED